MNEVQGIARFRVEVCHDLIYILRGSHFYVVENTLYKGKDGKRETSLEAILNNSRENGWLSN